MNFDASVYLLTFTAFALLACGALKLFRAFTFKLLAPVLAAAGLLVMPLTFTAGTSMAKADLTNYNEWWSGTEMRAWMDTITCTKDGPCIHEYDCDPYQVPVTKTRTVTDSKGNSKTETYVEYETRWHECPYVSHEYSYYVSDTMKETYSYGSHLFPADAEKHRWGHSFKALPAVASGVPTAWSAAKARIEAGTPGGTTKRHTYKNYVLAAQETVYRKYSDAIDGYLKEDLLPKPSSVLTAQPYFADKVYLVGDPAVAKADWQEEIQRFNGVFGGEKQGDLHLVIVNADRVPDGNSYNNALEAFWQDKRLGKDTLSKNGVVLLMGVSSTGVKWVNGFTGMPEGNEAILQAMRSFSFSSVTPQAVFSKTSPLYETLMVTPGFQRVEMKNYEYLEDSIKPTTGAHVGMAVVSIVLSAILGSGFVYFMLVNGFASQARPAAETSFGRFSYASTKPGRVFVRRSIVSSRTLLQENKLRTSRQRLRKNGWKS